MRTRSEADDLAGIPATRREQEPDAPTRVLPAVGAAVTRRADAPPTTVLRQPVLADATPTRQIDPLGTAPTQVLDAIRPNARPRDPEDGTPTRQADRADAAPTQQIDPAGTAPTQVLDAARPNMRPQDPEDGTLTRQVDRTERATSPHGNALGPQFRRLPAELDARYRALRDLSGGTQADVVVAEDRDTGREVAIKLYRMPGNPYDLATSTKLDRADTAHVVRVLDRGTANGHAWEVQEYCPHGTLLEAPDLRAPLSPARFHTVVTQLGAALVHLHGLSVVHRDMKPANVLVRSLTPLDLVLTDFGLSKEVAMSMDVGSIAGTFPYMPPEAHHGEIGSSGDWWALGVMAYQLLSGQHFLADATGRMPNEARIRHAIATGDYTVERVGDDRQWLLLRGLMTRDRRSRWGSAQFRQWVAGGSPAVAFNEAPPGERIAAAPTVVVPRATAPRVTSRTTPAPVASPYTPAPTVLAPRVVAHHTPAPTVVAPRPVAHHTPAPTVVAPRSAAGWPPPATGWGHDAGIAAEEQAQIRQREQQWAKEARRHARRSAELGLRQQWRRSLSRRVFARLAATTAWCVIAGGLLVASVLTSVSFFELASLSTSFQAMFVQYAPPALAAAALSLAAEWLLVPRPGTSKILPVTGALIGLQGSFAPSGAFLGLPVEVPLYAAAGWTMALLLSWVTARVGATFPGGVPLTPAEAGRRQPAIARTLRPLARAGGALAGGVALTTWFFLVVPWVGGAEAVIRDNVFLAAATDWLTSAVPSIDPLGLAQDPSLLAGFGLAGYLLAAFTNELHRLFRPLVWAGIAGATLAGAAVFFAAPGIVPLALIPSLAALLFILTKDNAG
ncbi:MAG TPA: protein kinase [Arachnia sp.]|nr:protein kinase [Arachnia sp.]HMT84965.1 protein kinase [Arachnia sp.]